jgi:DNA-binding response OmpR family regulator
MDLDEAFQAASWATVMCSSASAAREVLRQEQFDCIILDVLLPDSSGLDLLAELRGHPATTGIPVILLSTEAEVADRLRGLAVGADEYLGKPYDRQQVVSQARQLAQRAGGSEPPQAGATILAVDDSPTYLQALAEQLQKDNYDVLLARSGAEALALLQARSVDCILLDLMMPEMSGDEVCRRIKASPAWRSIPVVMLTGLGESEAIIESFNAGADDYVPKTSDFPVLRVRLRAQLRRRQFEEETRRTREQLHQRDFEVAQAKAAGEAARQWQATFNTMSDGVGLLGSDATLIQQNRAMTGIPGACGQDGILRPLRGLVEELLGQSRKAGRQQTGEVLLRDRWYRVTVDPAAGPLPAGVEAVMILRDITQQKAFQSELERLVRERTAKLQEAMGELEHFSYTITHDMRAPLRALQGFAGFLEDLSSGRLDAQSKEYLRLIKTSAARMDRLITDTLQYSKAGRQEMKLVPLNASALLHGIILSYPALQPPKAQIRIEDGIPKVLGNEAGLTQCFSNLLGNAVKFVEPGKLPVVRVYAQDLDGFVRLWFDDNGIGIPKPAQGKLFQMFQRATKGFEGTGVGLALVKKVAERMEGRVGVESEPGKGSRFWLDLKPAP